VHKRIPALSWKDAFIALGAVTAVLSHRTDHIDSAAEMAGAWGALQLAWLFLVTLGCAFRALERADAIAIRLGEMFAVLMILLGAFTGIALIVGGMRSKRHFNLESSATYISLLAALAAIGLVLPRFTVSTPGGYLAPLTAVFVAFACLIVYIAFVWRQTTVDRSDFAYEEGGSDHDPSVRPTGRQTAVHAIGLVATLLTITFLAEGLGQGVQYGIQVLKLPIALTGVVVAALILLPEGLAGLAAAKHGQMQRSVNVLLGSALSTIGLTVPAVLLLGMFTGTKVELGLEPPEIVLLCATLFITAVNFSRGRVGFSQGLVHLVLFLAWIALIFDQ
jgi:Ca2+:H+ antiporter